MKTCACGCGSPVAEWQTWSKGHDKRGVSRTPPPNLPVCACGCGATVKHPRCKTASHACHSRYQAQQLTAERRMWRKDLMVAGRRRACIALEAKPCASPTSRFL